jgi:hypothetical protein
VCDRERGGKEEDLRKIKTNAFDGLDWFGYNGTKKDNRKWIKFEAECKTEVPNRGAVKRCQGCRQLLNLLPFLVLLLLRVPQIVIYPGKGAAKFFSVLQGAVSQKRLKTTGVRCRKEVL